MTNLLHGWPGEALRQTRSIIETSASLMRNGAIPLQAVTMGTCAVLFVIVLLTLLGYLIYQVR